MSLQVLTWLGYSNSSFNPIIYSIFNSEFREAFRKILTQRLPLSSAACCCCSGDGGQSPVRRRRPCPGGEGEGQPLNGAILV